LILAIALAGEMLRRTVAHRLEQSDPRLALAWEPSDAAARENLANQLLAAVLATKHPATAEVALLTIRAVATRALADGPLHEAALRDFGIAAYTSGDKATARAIMTRASLRGKRDIAAGGWWLQQALESGDVVGAVTRVDALLRSQPDLEPRLFPVIAALVGVPAARSAWATRLAANPPWREAVLSDLAAKGPDTDATAALFLEFRARSSSPEDDELGALLTRIALAGGYDEARSMWVKLVPAGAASITAAPYDGAFRKAPGPAPFNWHIYPLEGGAAQMETVPGFGSVLSVSYPASAKPTVAEELLTLAPGAYRLSGKWRVSKAAEGAVTAWTLTCAPNGAPLGEWRHGVDAPTAWSRFESGVVVPATCPAQWLRLSGRAGDGFGDVEVAFASLSITPVSATQASR